MPFFAAHPRRTLRWTIVLAMMAAAAVATPATAAPSSVRADFDGDGYGDLAVGAPADSVSGQDEAGAVNVIYGSRGGLTQRDDQQFTKRPQRIAGVPQPGAQFGWALAAGDIDGDGFADLAISAPGEDVGGLTQKPDSGAVTVLYGAPGGLRPRAGASSWSQNSRGIKGGAEAGDRFGAALAIGDYDGDGSGDLAIGVPGDSVDGAQDAGAVNVIHGRGDGLDERGDQIWTQNTDGIKGVSGEDHRMGAALAAGEMSGNGRDDLAIGIPGGVIGGDRAGAVLVLYGRAGGLSSVDDLWSQDARGINGISEDGDRFGEAVAIGDFDGDRIGDLAVGVPGESVGNAEGAGAVNTIQGSDRGLQEDPDQLLTRETQGIRGSASIGEEFGAALAAADLSRNNADDLAIGVPGQEVDGAVAAGAVAVLYGKHGRGLRGGGDQVWHQDSAGIEGIAENGDRFGSAVAVVDVDGDGDFDLAAGAPGDSVQGSGDAGAVNVIHGSTRGLREDPDTIWTQGTSGIKGAVGNDRFGESLAGASPG